MTDFASLPLRVITLDGPAAAGKGTLSKQLAAHFNCAHLDSGALYRATALRVVMAGGDPDNADDALTGAKSLTPDDLTSDKIRTAEIGVAASKVAVVQAVRDEILAFQRNFGTNPPDGKAGAVIDGRDIGTVIFPEAPIKLFVTANQEARIERRFLEFQAKGEVPDRDQVAADLKARDERDRSRDIAPLKPAEDALLLDTSDLDIEGAFKAALRLIEDRLADI